MRRAGLATTWTAIATLGPNVTAYQDSGLTCHDAISAFDARGEARSPVTASITLPSLPFTTLTSGQPVRSSVIRLQNRYYKIYLPVKTSVLTVQTTGSRDIDLYLKSASQPTIKVNDCVGDGENTNEKSTVSNPASGDWYILVYGYAAGINNFTIMATSQSGAAATGETVIVPVEAQSGSTPHE